MNSFQKFCGLLLLSTFSVQVFADINNPVYANPASTDDLWTYSKLPSQLQITSAGYAPTNSDLAATQAAPVEGYVSGDESGSANTGLMDVFRDVSLPIDSRSLHLFSTYIVSEYDQTINTVFNGDDGHALWVDGVQVGAAGFNIQVPVSITLSANIPVKLELLASNYGGSWAIGIAQTNSTSAAYSYDSPLEDLPGISMNADGAFAETLSCVGFEAPMDKETVKVKKNRALPLKALLIDSDGFEVTGLDGIASPIVQVTYSNNAESDPVDVSEDLQSVGAASEGNQFVYTDDAIWQFNLSTKAYTAPGNYNVTMVSGDPSTYVIDPTCEATFVVE